MVVQISNLIIGPARKRATRIKQMRNVVGVMISASYYSARCASLRSVCDP